MKKHFFIISVFLALTTFFWLGFSSLANPFDISLQGSQMGNQNIILQPDDTVTLQVSMKNNMQGEVIYTFPEEIFRTAYVQLSHSERTDLPTCIVKHTHVRCTNLQKGDSVIITAKVKNTPTLPQRYILPLRVRSIGMTSQKSTQYKTLNWGLPTQYTPPVSSIRPSLEPELQDIAKQ